MIRHWTTVLTCIACFAIGGADRLAANTGRDLTAEETMLVEQGVRDALKDPDSARFSNFSSAVMEGGTIVACGLVNAKNSFGGYTGKSPFKGLLMKGTYETKFVVTSIGSSEDEERVTRIMCKKDSITLP